MRIGIVGAGMAGLACAGALRAAGNTVALFDKGQRPGGRMASRQVRVGEQELSFDHGAQYFTARDPSFAAQVRAWEAAGVVARWPVAGPDCWVGTPAMSAPVRDLAASHDVRWGTRIDAFVRDERGWTLAGAEDGGIFDAVIVATPAEQAVPLLEAHTGAFATVAAASRFDPCWTVMASFEAALSSAPDILRDAGAIGWAARNSAKPGRGTPEAWVIQASPDWSRAHLEDDAAAVTEDLMAVFARRVGPLPVPTTLRAHRWRFARSDPGSSPRQALWSPSPAIGACGDWLVAPRVEGAWLSGRHLAHQVIASRG